MEKQDYFFLDIDETLDDLILGKYKLIQSRAGYRFSIDAVLLAHFVQMDNLGPIAYDLGTGSAVISILLAALNPDIKITGIELQDSLFLRAKRNISINGLERRISVIKGDVCCLASLLPEGSSQLVVCNPPFWMKGHGKVSRNPEQAIARHELAGTLSNFVEGAAYLLGPGGRFCLIHRFERRNEIQKLLKQYDLKPSRQRVVHSFKDRGVSLLLIEGIKGYMGDLEELPPLYIYEEPGVYSKEVRAWYSKPGDEEG